MQSHVKSSSVILSLRCLVLMLSSPQYLVKFREEASSAAWTRSREVVSQQAPGKTDVVLGNHCYASSYNRLLTFSAHIPDVISSTLELIELDGKKNIICISYRC